MIHMQRTIRTAILMAIFFLSAPALVAAHSAVYTGIELDGVFVPYTDEHADENPFKGAIDLTVKNTGTEAWGDFHFMIFQAGWGIDNVFFTSVDRDGIDDYTPTSSQNLQSWTIDNGGHALDLYFYGDLVNPGDTANFRVYTDSTIDEVPFFGIGFYATPVPVPGALTLLGSGLLGLLGIRRRTTGA